MSAGTYTVCFCAIVKNEAHVLRDTLANVCAFFPITQWVVCDTGSTDGTQEVVASFFATRGTPGVLLEHPWRDFAHNRTRALAAARDVPEPADYILMWDADDRVAGTHVPWPVSVPAPCRPDAFTLGFGGHRPGGHVFKRTQVFSSRRRWVYEGVLHEIAVLDPADTGPAPVVVDLPAGPDTYWCVSCRTGARNLDPDKYAKDAVVLQSALAAHPPPPPHLARRYTFYCARSLHDAGQKPDLAVVWYLKVADNKDQWVQERYVACVQAADLLLQRPGDPAPTALQTARALELLVRTLELDPDRVEGTGRLVQYYHGAGMHTVAHMYATQGMPVLRALVPGQPLRQDKLFLQAEWPHFLFLYFVSLTAWYAKDLALGAECYHVLAQHGHVNSASKMRVLVRNRHFYQDHIAARGSHAVAEVDAYLKPYM
jgi:hypothetical protein